LSEENGTASSIVVQNESWSPSDEIETNTKPVVISAKESKIANQNDIDDASVLKKKKENQRKNHLTIIIMMNSQMIKFNKEKLIKN